MGDWHGDEDEIEYERRLMVETRYEYSADYWQDSDERIEQESLNIINRT